MKQFFKFMFASMAGFLLAIFFFFLFIIFFFSILMSSVSSESKVSIQKNSVLELTLDHPIPERTTNNPFDEFSFEDFSSEKNLGLNDILKNIEKASKDGNISGIFLNMRSIPSGLATVEEIRNALLKFRESNKFIYAYGEDISQGAYYLASVADRFYLHPEGSIDFRGFRAEMPFFKGSFEKLGVEPQVIRHGKFKSAVEPFINDQMSDENAEQIKIIITSFWDNALRNIAASRNLSVPDLQKAADEFTGRDAKLALEAGLVDSLAYFDEVNQLMKEKSGSADKRSAQLVPLKKYNKAFVKGLTEFSKDKIALIYANGDIVSGEGNENQIGSDRIAGTIRKARLDSSYRAIVLRVNSGGGSAMASDVIWREVVLARQSKPVVVSMGDYAASGGYYIACAADSIVAQPNTLTGSIGVFGLLINAKEMFNQKLGITFDTEKTARYADLGTISRSLSADERNLIQLQVEKVYDTFISHVAESRNVSKEYVDSIGQGRIWSGEDAVKLGLVDAIGGIDDALRIASGMAGLEKYRIVQLPEQKEIFAKILEDINAEAGTWFAKRELGEQYQYYERMKTMLVNQGIQARIPVTPEIR